MREISAKREEQEKVLRHTSAELRVDRDVALVAVT